MRKAAARPSAPPATTSITTRPAFSSRMAGRSNPTAPTSTATATAARRCPMPALPSIRAFPVESIDNPHPLIPAQSPGQARGGIQGPPAPSPRSAALLGSPLSGGRTETKYRFPPDRSSPKPAPPSLMARADIFRGHVPRPLRAPVPDFTPLLRATVAGRAAGEFVFDQISVRFCPSRPGTVVLALRAGRLLHAA